MAEIQQTQRSGRGKNRQKKVSLRVDFTPMVDMNMLLITFFMLATTMIKPQSMKITMPTNSIGTTPTLVPKSKAVTLYLGREHKVYYFLGEPDLNKSAFLTPTNFSSDGLRKLLLDKNAVVISQINELKKKRNDRQVSQEVFEKEVSKLKENTPVVMIKPLDNSTYNDMVQALDEMLITNIGKYMVTQLDANDKKMLKNSNVEWIK